MNLHCKKSIENKDRFLDGELTGKERRQFLRHLKDCPECRLEFAREKQIIDWIANLPTLTCPEKVTRRILTETGFRKERTSFLKTLENWVGSHKWQSFSLGFATVSVVVLFFLLNPFAEKEFDTTIQYTQEEIEKARNQALWSLAYAGKKIQDENPTKETLIKVGESINQASKNVVENIIMKNLPGTVRKSLQNAVPLLKGGQK
jgi:hypothetical protein